MLVLVPVVVPALLTLILVLVLVPVLVAIPALVITSIGNSCSGSANVLTFFHDFPDFP